jgi:hypothetical protein
MLPLKFSSKEQITWLKKAEKLNSNAITHKIEEGILSTLAKVWINKETGKESEDTTNSINYMKSLSQDGQVFQSLAYHPKKAIGNKDVKFINERRFYLERFLKKMSPFDFILECGEFKAFTRPNGDIEKIFNSMPKISTAE